MSSTRQQIIILTDGTELTVLSRLLEDKVTLDVDGNEIGREKYPKNCYQDTPNAEGMYLKDDVKIAEVQAETAKVQSKSDRTIACDALVITITNGKQFNGDKKSIADLKNAIETAREYAELYPLEAPLVDTPWKLYDDTIQTVTFAELQEAYVRGNLQYQQTFISYG